MEASQEQMAVLRKDEVNVISNTNEVELEIRDAEETTTTRESEKSSSKESRH